MSYRKLFFSKYSSYHNQGAEGAAKEAFERIKGAFRQFKGDKRGIVSPGIIRSEIAIETSLGRIIHITVIRNISKMGAIWDYQGAHGGSREDLLKNKGGFERKQEE